MICDPLTKAGPKGFADRLVSCMCTGELSLEPTVESQMKKLQQQKRRREKTLEKASNISAPTENDNPVVSD